MNKPILIAGALSVLITAANDVGGGADYHAPILASSMDTENKAIYSILWHFASTILALNAGALLWLGSNTVNRPMTQFIALQMLAFALLFLFYGITRMGSVWLLPQWTLFLVIAAFAWYGAARANVAS